MEYCMNPDRGKEIWATSCANCQIYCRINSSRVNWFFSTKMHCQLQLSTFENRQILDLFPPYVIAYDFPISPWICKTEPFTLFYKEPPTNHMRFQPLLWLVEKMQKTVAITHISLCNHFPLPAHPSVVFIPLIIKMLRHSSHPWDI